MEIKEFNYYHGVIAGKFDGVTHMGFFSCFARSIGDANQMAENAVYEQFPNVVDLQIVLERIDVAVIAYQLMALEKKHNENDSAK